MANLYRYVMQSNLCPDDILFICRLLFWLQSSANLSQNEESRVLAVASIALKVRIGLHLRYAATGSVDVSEFEYKRAFSYKKATTHFSLLWSSTEVVQICSNRDSCHP